jgi:D-lactate dehydrogenase
MKVLVYSTHGFEKDFLINANQNKHELHFLSEKLNENNVELSKGFDAISLFSSDNANANVLTTLHNLGVKYIALRSVGYDHVDITRAKELGIKITNVPSYSPQAIAEHAVALLMTLNRKIIVAQKLMQKNDFRLDELIGFDLYKKTVGVVGTGKIGAAFTKIMKGFGCNLIGYDITENKELKSQTGISYTNLTNLCAQADVIALFCPLNSSTKYLFNEDTFKNIKKGAILINTARGGVVDTKALLNAINNGIISQAGLDVYEFEKPIFFKQHQTPVQDELFTQLFNHPKVVLTGHQAFLTQEALSQIAQTTIDNLDQWGKLGKSDNEI